MSVIPLFVNKEKYRLKRTVKLFRILIASVFMIAFAGGMKCFAVGETSRTDHQITDGITESTVYVTVDGGYNVRTHILRIPPKSGVLFKASYGEYYGAGKSASYREWKAQYWDDTDWCYKSVRDQAADYESSPDAAGEVIAASNGDFYYVKSGKPEGGLVLEGTVIRKNNKRPFFAVLNNGDIVIREAGGKLSDVYDAVAGRELLLWNSKVTNETDGLRNPRTAIGICEDGTVVILNVDGREPASAGVTISELAEIMKAQGCTKAINLDGGGSASLMTKRAGDNALQFRSNHSDGPERRVGPAILVIKPARAGKKTAVKDNIQNMVISSTCLSRGDDGLYRYIINGKGQTGFFAINGETYLFSKGRGVTADIVIGKTTYSFYKGRLEGCSDTEAGNVIIGYCGGYDKKGTNLVYAYHEGNKLLNIGKNSRSAYKSGKMKNWNSKTVLEAPWYSVRAEISRIYLANGVVNIGNYALYSTKGTMTGGAKAPDCCLSSIRMPASLKEIGAYSLYNKPELTGVKIPSGVRKIGKGAFMYSGKGLLTFKGKTPPSFGSLALKKTGYDTICVRKSKAWKQFIKQKGFSKKGYKKAVAYK